eukprot:5888429-Pyramimonas_sp.AAC.1
MQIAVPINLMNGLSGTAYDAVRSLTHQQLRTFEMEAIESGGKGGGSCEKKRAATDGLELLLNALGESVLKERPARAAELFNGALYDKSAWRSPGESMQEYITRRSKAFDDLKK